SRVLSARGIAGRLEVWRFGKSDPDMSVPDIAKAAEWTVKENETRGPHFVRWQPRPEDLSQNLVSRAPEILPAAVLGCYPGKKPSLQVRAGGNRQRLKTQSVKVMQ